MMMSHSVCLVFLSVGGIFSLLYPISIVFSVSSRFDFLGVFQGMSMRATWHYCHVF